MAARGWGGSVAIAIGVAAGAGAAQLGLGYGLGIIAWLPSADPASEAAWVASLAWAAWIAATATVVGAICAERLAGPPADGSTVEDGPAGPAAAVSTGLWRIAIAVAAAMGALVTVALVAVPARAATRPDAFSPQTIAAKYAVIGVILGLLVAIWALSSRSVASNVIATVGWLWLLAVVAVVDGVISGRGLASAQLGVWQITTDSERFWFRNNFYWPGAALSLGSALLIGAVAARRSARRPATRVGAAVSGSAGPLLVAAAYFVSTPRLVGIRAEQLSAHLIAPYAVIAGLAGSVIMAALAQRAEASGRLGHTTHEGTAEPVRVPVQPTAAARPEDRPASGQTDGPHPPAGAYVSEPATDDPGAVRTGAPTSGRTNGPVGGRLRRFGRRER